MSLSTCQIRNALLGSMELAFGVIQRPTLTSIVIYSPKIVVFRIAGFLLLFFKVLISLLK